MNEKRNSLNLILFNINAHVQLIRLDSNQILHKQMFNNKRFYMKFGRNF